MPQALVLILLLNAFQLSTQQGVDRTMQREATGADVVRAVSNRIQAVFGNDRQFLRRIAFVESKDGTDSNTFRSGYHGGIWQVDEIAFRSTKDTASHPGLIAKHQQILDTFGINWSDVEWSDLRIPLFSGLAARLFVSNIPADIPCDISGQATYWKRHYNTFAGAGTEEKFMEDVNALNRMESCRVNSDIMLVLDESGSIGQGNFNSVREFVLRYINSLTIGPNDNRVGVITFDSTAQLDFGLGTHTNSATLSQAVRDITYSGDGTNIPAALCELHNVFSGNNSEAREDASVFRVAIVMTDGQSGSNINECGFRSVAEAAAAVHALSPSVLVFGFGVGDRFRQEDVEAIASGPEFVTNAQGFFLSQLECVQSIQQDHICNTISQPVVIDEENRGSLERDEQVRWQIDIPETGKLIVIEVEQGEVAFYASTETTAPNEAFYQWKLRTSSSSSVFIQPTAGRESNRRRRQIGPNSNMTDNLIPVYTTVMGLGSKNTFTLTGAAEHLQVNLFLLVVSALILQLF